MKEPMIWYKSREGFSPGNEKAEEFFQKSTLGELIEMSAKKTRNLRHHRKFFALLDKILPNTDFVCRDEFRYVLMATLGKGKWVEVRNATKPLFIAESLEFAQMDQGEFEQFYNDAINAIIKYFVPCDKTDLLRELASI